MPIEVIFIGGGLRASRPTVHYLSNHIFLQVPFERIGADHEEGDTAESQNRLKHFYILHKDTSYWKLAYANR